MTKKKWWEKGLLVLLMTSLSELIIRPHERLKTGAIQLKELLHYHRQTIQVSSPGLSQRNHG